MGTLLQLDGNILLAIQDNIRNDILTPFMQVITKLGDYGGIFWIVLSLTLVIIRRTRRTGICVVCAQVFSGVFTNLIIKVIVNRTRPYDLVDGLTTLINKPSDSSFPSGHASVAFASCIALLLTLSLIMSKKIAHRIGVAAVILATVISFSRLYLGVHYPTDVLAGALLGIAYGFAGAAVGKLIIKKMPDRMTNPVKHKPGDDTEGTSDQADDASSKNDITE